MAITKIVSLIICTGMLAVRIEKMQIPLKEIGEVGVVSMSAFNNRAQTLLSHQIRISDCLFFLTGQLCARHPPLHSHLLSIV